MIELDVYVRSRFELPAQYGHFHRVHLRYASWDLSHAYLCDPKTREVICRIYPQDKHRNAGAARRAKTPPGGEAPANATNEAPGEMAPLLRKLMADYAATGKPPGYIPQAPSTRPAGKPSTRPAGKPSTRTAGKPSTRTAGKPSSEGTV
jgi:hypothetical protein